MLYGIVSGAWGDALAGLAYISNHLVVGGAICTSPYSRVAKFVGDQDFIRDVRVSQRDKLAVCGWREPELRDYISSMLAWDCGLGTDHVVYTGLDFANPPVLTKAISLRQSDHEAAERAVGGLPPFIHFHPYSLNSTPLSHHHPAWGLVTELLHKSTAQVVKTGISPVCGRGIDLVGTTACVTECFAISNKAALTITTSNSIAVWCAMQGLPCVVLCNKKLTSAEHFWARLLSSSPSVKVVLFDDGIAKAIDVVSESLQLACI